MYTSLQISGMGGPITLDGQLNGAAITLTLNDNVGVMEIETCTDAGRDADNPGHKRGRDPL